MSEKKVGSIFASMSAPKAKPITQPKDDKIEQDKPKKEEFVPKRPDKFIPKGEEPKKVCCKCGSSEDIITYYKKDYCSEHLKKEKEKRKRKKEDKTPKKLRDKQRETPQQKILLPKIILDNFKELDNLKDAESIQEVEEFLEYYEKLLLVQKLLENKDSIISRLASIELLIGKSKRMNKEDAGNLLKEEMQKNYEELTKKIDTLLE